MAILLAHRDHRMFTLRYSFLTKRPVACDIAWIHARIVGALQSTFVAITLFVLARAVSSRRDASEVEEVGRRAIAHHRLALTQELVSNSEFKRSFLLNWWRVKHLKLMEIKKADEIKCMVEGNFFVALKIYSTEISLRLIYLNRCRNCWSFTKILLNTARCPTPRAPCERSSQLT